MNVASAPTLLTNCATPLTELKVMTELVTNWPQEFNRRHGEEMLEAIAENEALLDKLSLLSSAENERVHVESANLDLVQSVRSCVARLVESAEKRALTIDTEVENTAIVTDSLLWTAILNNLLGNAISHAPKGAHILVGASKDCLAVSNEAPELEAEDIPHLFERFWRKSEARSEKGHAGLGLAVVAACTEAARWHMSSYIAESSASHRDSLEWMTGFRALQLADTLNHISAPENKCSGRPQRRFPDAARRVFASGPAQEIAFQELSSS